MRLWGLFAWLGFVAVIFVLILYKSKWYPLDKPAPVVHAEDKAASWYVTDTGVKVLQDRDSGDGFILADGFWQASSSIRDKQLTGPITVKISCKAWEHACIEADAAMSMMGVLQPDFTEYAISSWTQTRLIAEDSNEGPCNITHRIVMDFKSETVTLTDLPSQVDTAECRMYRDANSYILHGGDIMLTIPVRYDPLETKDK